MEPQEKEVEKQIDWLNNQKFDTRKRFYENDESYHSRMLMVAFAFESDLSKTKWSSIKHWVEICPGGENDRLPRLKQKLSPHDCYYLKMRNISPENWLVPINLDPEPAQQLPRRATYKPKDGDVLLSRFKEPLGKCVIYEGELTPLYASSNFFMLRAKEQTNPLCLLGLLKSSFLAVQLHRVIKPRAVVTEMFQYEVPQILLPNLPVDLQNKVADYVEMRLKAEKVYRSAAEVDNNYLLDDAVKRETTRRAMSEVDREIDNTIIQFLAS
jgi:hypothetical protein